MKKIVFASYNAKKAEEIQRMAPADVKIICLKDVPEAAGIPQAEENGDTFIHNAMIKAIYWAEKLNMSVLAEDSGIEIDALNGYPGVHTKRCMEKLCPGAEIDEDNPDELYPRLLKLMNESGNKSKKACWVSAMALVQPETIICTKKELKGTMCSCAGERKFGFDQYFKPKGYTKTLSELSPEEKDLIGPRKKALEEVLRKFKIPMK